MKLPGDQETRSIGLPMELLRLFETSRTITEGNDALVNSIRKDTEAYGGSEEGKVRYYEERSLLRKVFMYSEKSI